MVLFHLVELNRFKSHLDGNGSIISSVLPYQTFMSLIGTCRMGSDPFCCEGFLPLSTHRIHLFFNSITLKSIWSYIISFDVILLIKCIKLWRTTLTTIISHQHLNLLTSLIYQERFKLFNWLKSWYLHIKRNPCPSIIIIIECHIIYNLLNWRNFNRTKCIRMN